MIFLGVFIYGWHLAGKVENRFSSRRWSITSKVFTDTMLIYPGQRLNRGLFQEKLKRMGYREACMFGNPPAAGFRVTNYEIGLELANLSE